MRGTRERRRIERPFCGTFSIRARRNGSRGNWAGVFASDVANSSAGSHGSYSIDKCFMGTESVSENTNYLRNGLGRAVRPIQVLVTAVSGSVSLWLAGGGRDLACVAVRSPEPEPASSTPGASLTS